MYYFIYIFYKYVPDLRKILVKSEVEGKKLCCEICWQAKVKLMRTTWPILITADSSPTLVWALLLELNSYLSDFGDFRKCRSPCWVMEFYLHLASFSARFRTIYRPRCLLYTYLHSTTHRNSDGKSCLDYF